MLHFCIAWFKCDIVRLVCLKTLHDSTSMYLRRWQQRKKSQYQFDKLFDFNLIDGGNNGETLSKKYARRGHKLPSCMDVT